MAFGLKHIQGAEDDKARALKKELQEQSDDSGASESSPVSLPVQSGNRFARRGASPSVAQASGNEPSQPAPARAPAVTPAAKPVVAKPAQTIAAPAANSFMKAKANFENEGDVTPEMYSELPLSEFDDDEKEDLVVAEEEVYGPTAHQKLALRARRLAQEVGEFKKWSLDAISVLERRAQREPQVVIDELLPVYRNEVQPTRQVGFRSLDEAVKKHTDETVFLLVKGDKDRVRVVPKGTGQDVLNGAVLESLQANSTPFDSPKYVLPKLFEKAADPVAAAPKSAPAP